MVWTINSSEDENCLVLSLYFLQFYIVKRPLKRSRPLFVLGFHPFDVMKLPESLRTRRKNPQSRRERRKGVALVTVLTVISLTTILVLTFFSLASSEHRASNVYSNGLQAQHVAEQAVNLVIAQIREATTTGTEKVWASQPGAIRTWKENGDKDFAYKLYSDDRMKTNDWAEFRQDFADLNGWSTKPDHFVDLNEPVIRGEKVYYPIVHPASSAVPKWPASGLPDGDGVEGFRFNEERRLAETTKLSTDAARIAESRDGHLAMPVKWIYQLADGTLGVLSDSASGAGGGYAFQRISGNGTASAKNPIVARFAFWADDETTKLNINTHAGGLAWDVPKTGGRTDMDMGRYQPGRNEWQRYPGHPATTHLSPAMAPGVIDIVNDRDAMEMLYRVVPRVVEGGSRSGTRLIDTRVAAEANGLVPDKEPLFPSLDDVIMRSDREPHEFPDPKGRPIPSDELSEYLERAKFFITANSRAPETNIFNLPRVAIWPIYNADPGTALEKTHLTAFDRIIRYCASMGRTAGKRNEYIFRRQKADSATFDYENIPRNKELYKYLERFFTANVPGYGANFAAKYEDPKEAQQILTLIFDYIRSTNLHDDTLYEDFQEAFQKVNNADHRTYTNPRDQDEPGFGHKGHGQVTPIEIEGTKGMGRFFTLAGSHVHIICAGQPGVLAATGYEKYPGAGIYRPVNNTVQLEAPTGRLFANLPPLPPNVNIGDTDKSHWPQWLKDLEMTDPEEFQAAFQPENWNWQLAFLSDVYRDAVLSNPTANKYQRSLITTLECEKMRLQDNEMLAQAVLLFDLFSPSIGWGSINPDMEIEIRANSGMTFSGLDGNYGFLGFEGYGAMGGDTYVWATNWAKPHKQGGARSWGGLLPFGYVLTARQPLQEGTGRNERNVWYQLGKDGVYAQPGYSEFYNFRSRLTPLDRGYDQIESALSRVSNARNVRGATNSVNDIAQAYRYDLVTVPFKIQAGSGSFGRSGTVEFNGGRVQFDIYDAGAHTEASAPDDNVRDLVQSVELEFPPFSITGLRLSSGYSAYINEFNALSHDSSNGLELASLTAESAVNVVSSSSKASMRSGSGSGRNQPRANAYGRMGLLVSHWDGSSSFIRDGDIVRSVAVSHGDARIVAARKNVAPDEVFKPHRYYSNAGEPYAHSLINGAGVAMHGFDPSREEVSKYLIIPDLPKNPDRPYRDRIPLPFATDESKDVQLYGDFDNGSGLMTDGPYINKPDEGNVHALKTRFMQEINDIWESRRNRGDFPYFSSPDLAEAGGPAYFSPNRIVSGPGMFGSLPTGVQSNIPWRTLLFRPNVVGPYYESHPGAGKRGGGPAAKDPPDHLIMDYFWMPVVEPYAISEPLSTGGKVNMNYQIVPFLHVTRNTALRGVFRSEMMVLIPNGYHRSYKHNYGRGKGYHWRDAPLAGEISDKRLRSVIKDEETLSQFEKRFGEGENLFMTSSEICEIHLVPEEVSDRLGQVQGRVSRPEDMTLDKLESGEFWKKHSLIGDNSRERPYTNIHTRLTTKSNTFLVHYRAQVLKQARRDSDADYGEWRPELDTVQAEYRGSSMVERYVNPEADDIPDFASISPTSPEYRQGLDPFYRYRVVNPRRFAP